MNNFIKKVISDSKQRRYNTLVVCLAFVLLGFMFTLEFTSALSENQIIDEGVHLMSGFSYLKTGIYNMNREHPPLLKLLAGVPLLFTSTQLYTTDPAWTSADQWAFTPHFLYNNIFDAESMLLLGRLPIMLISLILGWFIFVWSKKLFGSLAGLFSLALYAFDPNIIAHSRYVTTDIGIACAFTIAAFLFVRYIKNPSTQGLILLSVAFGCAQITKFSAILLFPFLGIFFIIYNIFYIPQGKRKSFFYSYAPKIFFGTIIGTIVCITIAYSPSLFALKENTFIPSRFYETTHYFIPFYQTYLDGLIDVIGHTEVGHYAYLTGHYSIPGWWYYFPIAFLVKTPLSTLILFILLIVSLMVVYIKKIKLARQYAGVKYKKYINIIPFDYIVLFGTPLLYVAVSMTSHINIGWRHIAPIYPFLFVAMGKLMELPWYAKKWWRVIMLGFLTVLITSSCLAYPYYLSYFSEIIGGAKNGYKYLLDSNLDWGQDLKRLKKYMIRNKIDWVYFAYFGKAEASYYQLDFQDLPLYATQKQIEQLNGVAAINISRLLAEDKSFEWLYAYQPFDTIGNSIYLYDFRKK